MKRLLNSLIMGLFVIGVVLTALPSQSDAATSYPWAEEAAQSLVDQQILQGDGNGDLMLGNSVTRDQFAAFIARALDLKTTDSQLKFSDVSQKNVLYNEIYEAASAGIVKGNPDGTFAPSQKITREQMALMIERMLVYKGLSPKTAPLNFTDVNKIDQHQEFLDAIKDCVARGIILGDPSGAFRPKDDSIRAEAVVVIYRALNEITAANDNNNDGSNSALTDKYVVGTINNGQIIEGTTPYTLLADAKKQATNSNQVIFYNNKVVWMHSGLVQLDAYTILHDTFAMAGTQMKYLDSTGDTVKAELAGNISDVPVANVTLIPSSLVTSMSYYTINDRAINTLYHHINGSGWGYEYGAAPDFMMPGVKYYSWDGHTFYNTPDMTGTPVGTAYQYFNILPLNTNTSLTADQLNQYVKDNIPSTYETKMGGPGPLATLGNAFIKAQQDYGVNATYLLAHAIIESGWGSSKIAQEKFNLFGINAVDSNPYGQADTFYSYEDCVYYEANMVSAKYQDPSGAYYFGSMLGNKGIGMNMKYASDPNWGQIISGYMYDIDRYFGGKDFNQYQLAVATSTSLNARTQPTTSPTGSQIVYQYPENHMGAGMIVVGTTTNTEGDWYKIWSDRSDFRNPGFVYVYHDGKPYGLLSNIVNIAK